MEMMRCKKICNAGNKNDCADYGNVTACALVYIRKLIIKRSEKWKREENIV
jgi:hypothetical protein